MSVGDSGLALHAFFRPFEAAATRLSAVLEARGLACGEWRTASTGNERAMVARQGALTIQLSYSSGSWCQLGLFRLHSGELSHFGAAGCFDLLTDLCESVRAHLGRSDRGGGAGLVQEAELFGAIDALDWFLYLGPELAKVYSSRLAATSLPYHRRTLGGAFAFATSADPLHEDRPLTEMRATLCVPSRPTSGCS